jgi:diguanylate cyclase (GGDEF)-like protein
MFQRFFSQFLLDLGDLEGEYRAFHLKDDVRQSSFYISLAATGVLGMLASDAAISKDRPDLFTWMILFRAGFALASVLVIVTIWRTVSVRLYDRVMMGWMSLVVLFLLLFNFTRPANFLTTAYDVILPLAIYIISPLTIFYSFALAFGFTTGTLYIDHFHKTGIDSATLNMVIVSQVIVHIIGLTSSIQIHSYRRKSYRAFIQEKDAKEMVAYLANIDPLTKSMTRHHFFSIAETEFLRYSRYRRPFSMLVLDADQFKRINDTYGHYAGDMVLRSLSLVILEQKRTQDTYGRLGGEEFGILLPETSLEQAIIVAERIQNTWDQTPCQVEGNVIHSTVSIGVTEVHEQDQSFEEVLRRADRMMYKAKEAGRNNVVGE